MEFRAFIKSSANITLFSGFLFFIVIDLPAIIIIVEGRGAWLGTGEDGVWKKDCWRKRKYGEEGRGG